MAAKDTDSSPGKTAAPMCSSTFQPLWVKATNPSKREMKSNSKSPKAKKALKPSTSNWLRKLKPIRSTQKCPAGEPAGHFFFTLADDPLTDRPLLSANEIGPCLGPQAG